MAGLLAGVLAPAVRADLPSLGEKEWLGYFIGVSERGHRFGLTAKGAGLVQVLNAKGQPLTSQLNVTFDLGIREIQPGDKIVWHAPKPESLESATPATTTPENVVIRGQTGGDAAFEATINANRGALEVSGHLLDKGKLTKNPADFAVRIKFPNVYPYNDPLAEKQKIKAFEKKTSRDQILLSLANNKREKLDPAKSEPEKLAAAASAGIVGIRVEFSAYPDARFEISAPAGTKLLLAPKNDAPLRDGFTLDWIPGPDGKKPLVIDVK